jgi:hypothetical protein
MIWLGLYPKPVLDRMDASARRYVEQVQPGFERQPATALQGPGKERP